jgi:hypothetical protein
MISVELNGIYSSLRIIWYKSKYYANSHNKFNINYIQHILIRVRTNVVIKSGHFVLIKSKSFNVNIDNQLFACCVRFWAVAQF